MWLKIPFLRWLYLLFNPKLRKQTTEKVQSVKQEYQDLIEEYGRIQNKQSNLSRSKRDEVVRRVHYLVGKGHIRT